MTALNRATVRAVNSLTARWAGFCEGGTVFAAAGIWPLLGFLADGADEAVRRELVDALGLPPDKASRAARGLLAALDAMEGVEAALGLWTHDELPLREAWSAKLPQEAHARLSGDLRADTAALDRWAAERTDGLIDTMPVDLGPETWLVLASALVLRTEWERPFEDTPLQVASGPWQGRSIAGLTRSGTDLDSVALATTPDGAVTRLLVRGDNGIDVHLLLGDDQLSSGQVLGAGIGMLGGTLRLVPGDSLAVGTAGPGLLVTEELTLRPQPRTLTVGTPRFTVGAEHDLLAHAGVFGLHTATDGAPQHFQGVSPAPLALRSARQTATATFSATGFKAAAVTALGIDYMGKPPEPRHTSTVLRVLFDRPFGFLAVHRTTRLVLAAGRVEDPEPYREDEGY
ncbi:serpin family protein [Streptomyces monticola]|uniref:Serpin family protein n=1 Tax=Streptomyces monticola TaxID=2666263 RepID=A0ABW2JIB9_9ACTN